jgi:PHD/YefM family antitoxin component YafN of YafNO toxin-antitoxin module
MNSTYTVGEASAQFPRLIAELRKEDQSVTITEQGRTTAFLVSEGKMMALLETMEILANPKAMTAIRKAKAGQGKYYPLSVLDED